MAWVLNDPPPDFALELAKCQYYLRPLNDFGQSNVISETTVRLNIRKPSNMRSSPTFTNPIYGASWAPVGYGTTNPNNIALVSEDSDQIVVQITGLASQAPSTNGLGVLLGWWDSQL